LSGVRPVLRTPSGVEAIERRAGDRRLLFLLNHTDRPRRVRLGPGMFTDPLESGPSLPGGVALPPLGVRVIETGTKERAKGP
jgi:beta-galactosidase